VYRAGRRLHRVTIADESTLVAPSIIVSTAGRVVEVRSVERRPPANLVGIGERAQTFATGARSP
jgi:hypothetical protein